ncbi:hypothetical protein [Halovivax cerinus]|uniref:Small CPxCG-related zinc finger protein n=1 Tax=Halovivax cerinus TaxID=1487865 RepID=A0ABD5NQS1_9EURY|nr:hypothetical protein [Halovivax cerinus]
MNHYTPNTDKRHAQPAYRLRTPTDQSSTPLHLRTDLLPRVACADDDDAEYLVLDPAPPSKYSAKPGHRPVDYPPCPHCGEPVITVWMFGPDMHTADPCQCALTREEVVALGGDEL